MRNIHKNKYKKYNIHKFITINRQSLLLLSIFFAGVVIGVLASKNQGDGLLQYIKSSFNCEIYINKGTNNLIYFTNSLFSGVLYLFLSFTFGLCYIGIPIIFLFPLIRGISYGVAAGNLYSAGGSAGAGYFALCILPGAVVSTAAILMACRESIIMSAGLVRAVSDKKPLKTEEINMYIRLHCFMVGILTTASLADMFLNKYLAGNINI